MDESHRNGRSAAGEGSINDRFHAELARRNTWLRRLTRNLTERTIVSLITLCGIAAILFVFSIFLFIFREGFPFFRQAFSVRGFFLSMEWHPTSEVNPRFGILALLCGTLSVTLVSMALAVPFGLGTAVFISEFSSRRVREALKIVIEFLAAIPSVVWGFVGLMVLNPIIIKLTGCPIGLNVLNAGIIVGLMSVPIIVSIAEDALRAVPEGYREAAAALGATRWQAAYRVVLPAARSGLLAAVLLGVGRAVGETMATLMATGHSIHLPFSASFPYFHVLDSVRTLTATIAAELGEAPRLRPGPDGLYPPGALHYQSLFVIGIVLFAITSTINLVADFIVKGIRKHR
jgi:phosphate transport system permease protein